MEIEKKYEEILNNEGLAKEFVKDFQEMGFLSVEFKNKYKDLLNGAISLFNACVKEYDL